jgi:hypothetical protein
MPIKIVAKKDGFRRAGRAHSGTTFYPDGTFTLEELKALMAEPMLEVSNTKPGEDIDAPIDAPIDGAIDGAVDVIETVDVDVEDPEPETDDVDEDAPEPEAAQPVNSGSKSKRKTGSRK